MSATDHAINITWCTSPTCEPANSSTHAIPHLIGGTKAAGHQPQQATMASRCHAVMALVLLLALAMAPLGGMSHSQSSPQQALISEIEPVQIDPVQIHPARGAVLSRAPARSAARRTLARSIQRTNEAIDCNCFNGDTRGGTSMRGTKCIDNKCAWGTFNSVCSSRSECSTGAACGGNVCQSPPPSPPRPPPSPPSPRRRPRPLPARPDRRYPSMAP